MARSDFDSAWKDSLDAYFPQCMALLWPALHALIDWRHEPVFRDKELQALIRSRARGRRHVDKLVSLRLLGCQLTFAFPVVHLEYWRPRQEELAALAPHNPFAVVILAQLQANATRNAAQRLVRKTELVRRLYHWGFNRDNIVKLFRIIDAMVGLPESLEPAFDHAVSQIEEETQMSYVTSIERVRLRREREEGKVEGKAEGKVEGKAEGKADTLMKLITRKFGHLPDWARARLTQADQASLDEWTLRILDAQRIEDVFN